MEWTHKKVVFYECLLSLLNTPFNADPSKDPWTGVRQYEKIRYTYADPGSKETPQTPTPPPPPKNKYNSFQKKIRMKKSIFYLLLHWGFSKK